MDCHNAEHMSSPGTTEGLRFDHDGNLKRVEGNHTPHPSL